MTARGSGAPVRVDERHDPRFAALAHAGGYASPAEALGLMVYLWGWQTDHYTDDAPTYEVSDAIVVGIFGPRGPEALIAADLAERTSSGKLYIRGSRAENGAGRTRIDWRFKLRKVRSSAGEAGGKQTGSKRRAKLDSEQDRGADVLHGEATTEANAKQTRSSRIYDLGSTSGTPALAPLALTPSGPRPRRARARKPEVTLPDTWQPTDAHRARARELELDLDHEVRLFRANAATHERTAVNWNGAFTTWLEKSRAFARRAPVSGIRGSDATDEMLRREGILP